MTPADLATLKRAEGLIRADADATKESCSIGERQWQCDCKPGKCSGRESYREHMEAVAALMKMRGA